MYNFPAPPISHRSGGAFSPSRGGALGRDRASEEELVRVFLLLACMSANVFVLHEGQSMFDCL